MGERITLCALKETFAADNVAVLGRKVRLPCRAWSGRVVRPFAPGVDACLRATALSRQQLHGEVLHLPHSLRLFVPSSPG